MDKKKEVFERPKIEIIELHEDDFIVTWTASEGIYGPEYPDYDL